MPELPEVEHAARRLRRAALGRVLVRITVHHPAYVRRLPPAARQRAAGHRVRAVQRHGKFQLIHLDGGLTLVAHFRMTGDWEMARDGRARSRFARATLHFDDGSRVFLDDPRALGTLTLAATDAGLPVIGMDPLSKAFTARALGAAFVSRRTPVKVALLDQRLVAGIGNIYAAEALWKARIDPRTPAGALATAAVARLARAIVATLRRASGRLRHRDGEGGRFEVYGRADEPCRRCGGTIYRIVQAGRSTYGCQGCQH